MFFILLILMGATIGLSLAGLFYALLFYPITPFVRQGKKRENFFARQQEKWLSSLEELLKTEGNIEKELVQKIENFDWDSRLERIIDIRLDSVMASFRAHIPLGGVFLGDALSSRFKAIAKGEILKSIPDLKQSAIQAMQRDLGMNAALQEKGKELFSSLLQEKLLPLLKREFYKGALIATLWGASVGTLFAGIIYLLGI